MEDARKLSKILEVSVTAYARKRSEIDLWKQCEGKQVLNTVARASGYAGVPSLMSATFAAWEREGAQLPDELMAFRNYLR